MSNRLLIAGCDVVVTMDDAGREITGGSILIEDGVIRYVGSGRPPGSDLGIVLDGRGCIAIPGLVNAHHHLYQSLTRVSAQAEGLFGWLTELYPIWTGVDPAWVRDAAAVGLAELALSGCTTTTDHHYIFPDGRTGILEAEVGVAREMGLRFHPCRGSMDLGRSRGGLPPDEIVEDADNVLARTDEAIAALHDPAPGSMLRIAVAPCSPFSATPALMRGSAELARRRGVRLHTHIAETLDEEAYCRETFGMRPLELLDDLGWLGRDVWLAHCVHLSDADVVRIAGTGTSVAWCPTSNLRLGSGVAPSRALLDAGAAVGLAVDGSASNDSGHLLAEVRQAMLVARGRGGAGAMSAREALRVATRGGAACLGREDIGVLEAGRRGDVALFGLDGLGMVGAEADPVAALLFCHPGRGAPLVVEGRPLVRDGVLLTMEEQRVVENGRRAARQIRAVGGRA